MTAVAVAHCAAAAALQRGARISGSKNFHSSPQKDFCNNIYTFRTRPNARVESATLILLGPKRPALLIDGEAKPFEPAAFDACAAAAPGYSMGFDVAVRAKSIADTVSFPQRSMRP
jgi:hypothetical protein